MTRTRTFWLDEEFDREHAEPGTPSRFGSEVRRRADAFAPAWGDIAPVTFAVVAWQIATALSPGYVRWHRRVVTATCGRSPWDGSLTCAVTLVSPWPAQLTSSRQWGRDRGWRDWPQLFGQYAPPSEQDLTRSPHLRATLLIEAPIPPGDLPPAPDGPDGELEDTARRAVRTVARELDDLIGPIVAQLESGVPTQ